MQEVCGTWFVAKSWGDARSVPEGWGVRFGLGGGEHSRSGLNRFLRIGDRAGPGVVG